MLRLRRNRGWIWDWRRHGILPGAGLFALLLLAVLVPSACLLWFMNQAVRNERLAGQQQLSEVYRGNLTLARDRLAAFLANNSLQVESLAAHLSPSESFAHAVRSNLVDALVCFDLSNHIEYPISSFAAPKASLPSTGIAQAEMVESEDPARAAKIFESVAAQSDDPNLKATALGGLARCLLRAGEKAKGIQTLESLIASPRLQDARDEQGRLTVLNAELSLVDTLALEEALQGDHWRLELKKRLCNYAGAPVPSAQRSFLMRHLLEKHPDPELALLAKAEALAADSLAAGLGLDANSGLRATTLPGIWKLQSPNRRVVALHTTEDFVKRFLASTSPDFPGNIRVNLTPPGSKVDRGEWTLNAGDALPGWELSLAPSSEKSRGRRAEDQISSYLWIGLAMLTFVLLISLLAAGLLRRQLALTRLRNDLVANVTHELKTPLASTRLLVDTLLETPEISRQTAREYLEMIAGENARLGRLIDNFLTFSRIERNKTAFKFSRIAPGELLEKSVAAMSGRLHAPGCQFSISIASCLPDISADPDAIVTAIINLLDNALKYTGEAKEIILKAIPKNGRVLISVKDNGIGISAREISRIFRRYYQVNGASSPHIGGCGLGLSIVEFVAREHHGEITVLSEPGSGSEFILNLPALPEALNAGSNGASPGGSPQPQPHAHTP